MYYTLFSFIWYLPQYVPLHSSKEKYYEGIYLILLYGLRVMHL